MTAGITTAPAPPKPAVSSAARFTSYFRTDAPGDLAASLVVFLVAIPLSLGVASAAGAPLLAGLIAAVIGGIVTGAIAGAPLQVSGAAVGLTVVVAQLIAAYGFAATAAITIAAGALQIGLGITKVGRSALSLSPAIVHGMMAGLGIVIVVSQVHVLLGGSPQQSVVANLAELPAQLSQPHLGALTLGILTIALLISWRLTRHTRLRRLAAIPAPLVAVLVATLLATTLRGLSHRPIPAVSLPDDPLAALTLPALPTGGAGGIAIAICTVAIIASVESLLSAVAVEKLRPGSRSNLDQELVAQGVGNMVSGALGGFPLSGGIVRSSTNVATGARTRNAAILHGTWMAAAVVFGVGMLEQIPLAALAAVLIVVGGSLIQLGHAKTVYRHHELPAYLVTLLAVVFVNVLVGMVLGVATATLVVLYRLTHTKVTVGYESPGRWRADISGTVTFASTGKIRRLLAGVPAGQHVTIELHTDFLDHAAFEALREWSLAYELNGGHVRVHDGHEPWFTNAHEGTPHHRRQAGRIVPRWLAPWSQWQAAEGDTPHNPVIAGIEEFQRNAAPLVRPVLAELAVAGQRPHQLFITCADSRVVPNVITSSGPGDLFTLRNVGNFVPPHGSASDDSVGAGIEFAVDGLRVSSIAVCGHSDCGAMKALLEGAPTGGTHLNSWLRHGAASLRRSRQRLVTPDMPPGAIHVTQLNPFDQLCVHNIAQQLDNLATYPGVAAAVAGGRVAMVGMFFEMYTARVFVLDRDTMVLTPVAGPTNRVAA